MKLKDTIHFNWYKHLFIVLVIGLCVAASAGVTEADILDVFGNLEQMSGFLSRFLKPDFSYIPNDAIAVQTDMEPELKEKVKEVFLNMKDDEAGQEAMSLWNHKGYEEANDSVYDTVKDYTAKAAE